MDWTRSLGARVAALLAATALVVIHWSDRGTWFWVGAALFLLNLVGLARARAKGPAPASRAPSPGGAYDGTEVVLADLDVPEVVAAFEEGPDTWAQVSHLDGERLDAVPWRFIAQHVWLELDGQWSIGLGDEVKPYLDLDVDPDDDPVLSVLRAHPAVRDAWHEDREVYAIEQRATMTVEEFGTLVARALVAHQRYVRDRAS